MLDDDPICDPDITFSLSPTVGGCRLIPDGRAHHLCHVIVITRVGWRSGMSNSSYDLKVFLANIRQTLGQQSV